jgi:NAD(P)H-hydrate epimerase
MTQPAMSRDEVRDVDRRAIKKYGIPGIVLMENAGRGAAQLLVELGIRGPIVICSGRGNNGGDGFVIARHLENCGERVRVLLFCDPADLRGDAATNYKILVAAGMPLQIFGDRFDPEDIAPELANADWIVDALLGTGAVGNVCEPYGTVIDCMNKSGKKVLAVDLPSGLDCDSGESLGQCVRANHTATFVARKIGFDSATSQSLTGTVHVIDIGVPRSMFD